MEKLITATLRSGKQIAVLPREIEQLREAGLLAKDFRPEEETITKDAAPLLDTEKKPDKLPVNISKASIKRGKKA